MPVTDASTTADAREALQGARGPVIVTDVSEDPEDILRCLAALLRHTPADVDVLIVGDRSRAAGWRARLPSTPHRLVVLANAAGAHPVGRLAAAIDAAGRRDVVVLDAEVDVGPGWLDGLRDAAYADSRIATATPLTARAGPLSIDLPDTHGLDDAAVALATGSGKLRPRLPTCFGDCTFVRRMALDVVGEIDPSCIDWREAIADVGQRCVLAGLAHVCADDVLVGRRTPRATPPDVSDRLTARYPYLRDWVTTSLGRRDGVLPAAIRAARRVLCGMSVVVDATQLLPQPSGTQRVLVETIRVLARHPGIARLTIVVPDAIPALAADVAHLDGVTIVRGDAMSGRAADVAYRPVQIWAPEQLERLRAWGERVVVTQLDLIAFENPGYFTDWSSWAAYRDLTRRSLASAQGVAFLSHHAEREARTHRLLPAGQRTTVTYCGTDHEDAAPSAAPTSSVAALRDASFVLCLGADFRHKNRLFALRVFAEMRARGYDGHLVLAGPRMFGGTSGPPETDYLQRHPDLATRVLTLEEVSDGDRSWLYRHARLVIHPTLHEGFGLVPFEAAAAGVPCLTSAHGSLAETLPDGVERITDWDGGTVACQAMALIDDDVRRRALVESLAQRGRSFTWSTVADRLVDLFDAVARARPEPEVTAVAGESVTTAPARVLPTLDGVYPRAFLEALRAIAERPTLRRPVVGATVLAYRLVSRLRTRRS